MFGIDEVRELKTREGTPLAVRRLTRRHAVPLQRFGSSLHGDTERWFRAHSYDDATVAKLLRRSEEGEDLILGLFDGPDIVGYFFLWYFSRPVPLLGIGLLDPYQGRGLGRRLMLLLIEEARNAGRRGIELTTNLDNDRAFALYGSLGFRFYGTVENLHGDGKVCVERGMYYAIAPGPRPRDTPHAPPV